MIEYIAFDIETTGLHPLESELVSWATGSSGTIQDNTTNEKLLLEDLVFEFKAKNKSTTTIITYMGGTLYSPGFDFPYLRTKFLKYGMAWPFKGFNHIDLYPIIQKWFDTTYSSLATFDTLNFDHLKALAKVYDIKPGTSKDVTKTRIMDKVSEHDIETHILLKNIMVESTHNGLKDCSANFLDIPDDGIHGDQVPKMFAEWKETGDESILKPIMEYNNEDCRKTMTLFEAVRDMVPNRILSGELL